MKRQNSNLLMKSFEAMFDCQNEQSDGDTWRKELGDFIWYLSVARKEELAEVYKAVVKDTRFWDLAVEVHAIFGRVYAASLSLSNPKEAAEVSSVLVRPYCDPCEWADFIDGLAPQMENGE